MTTPTTAAPVHVDFPNRITLPAFDPTEIGKLHLCAAKDAGRYSMYRISLDRTGRAVATDGRKMASIKLPDFHWPIALDGQDEVPVPKEAWKALTVKKGGLKVMTIDYADCGERGIATVTSADGSTQAFRFNLPGLFPKWEAVIPTVAPTAIVTIDAKYLAEVLAVAGASNDGTVTLEIRKETGPVRIVSTGTYPTESVVMPITLEGPDGQKPEVGQKARRIAALKELAASVSLDRGNGGAIAEAAQALIAAIG